MEDKRELENYINVANQLSEDMKIRSNIYKCNGHAPCANCDVCQKFCFGTSNIKYAIYALGRPLHARKTVPQFIDGAWVKKKYNQKSANLTEEEKEIREENLRCRKNFDIDGIRRLAAAIDLQAVIDYRNAKQGHGYLTDNKCYGQDREFRNNAVMWECEQFFHDPIFTNIIELEDEGAIQKIAGNAPLSLTEIYRNRK